MPDSNCNSPRSVSRIDASSIKVPSASTSQKTPNQSFTAHDSAISAGKRLLDALWLSPDRCHQIGILDRQTGHFSNIPVSDAVDAIEQAKNLSSDGAEVYFACAEFKNPDSRTAANALGACGFWLDIDSGEDKAAAEKDYPTPEAAEVALLQFCNDTGLPRPTHIVHSGGGIHAYWALNGVVVRDIWQSHARKLKDLTKAHGFLADDSRTADIASVLRVPGTLNHKYEPPRPVSRARETADPIDRSEMLSAIEAAHTMLCITVPAKRSGHASISDTAGDDKNVSSYRALDIERLSSALAMLEPDCNEETWKLRRLAPLAEAARVNPDMCAELRELARAWSSGKLGCCTSIKWITPGGNGRTGSEVFDEVWLRFLAGKYTGTPITLGTVYYDAILAGWDPDDPFQIFDSAAGEGA